jgi:perosamine synthetase
MIQWWNTDFGENEALAAAEVVRSGQLNEGPVTRKFEAIVAEYLKVKHVKAVPNGTIALATALWALKIGPGDEVLIPDVTFIATANAVRLVGAVPILVDVNRHDMNISMEDLEKKISRQTKAIIIVHINGRACDIEALRCLKQKYDNIPIIEDTAQGLGSCYHNAYLGTIFDVGTISLAPSKVISTGQGGLILTNSDQLRDQFIRFKDHGRLSRSEVHHPQPGFNFKFTDVQAAIGIEQFKRLPVRLEKAKSDYWFYKHKLKGIEELYIPDVQFHRGEVPLWIDAISIHRTKLLEYLKNKEIYPRPLWTSLHTEWLGQKGEFPNSLFLNDTAFWLPSGPCLAEKEMEIVASEIIEFFKTQSIHSEKSDFVRV